MSSLSNNFTTKSPSESMNMHAVAQPRFFIGVQVKTSNEITIQLSSIGRSHIKNKCLK